jgi:hypothetical protein
VAGKIDSVVPSRAFGSTVGDDRVAAPPHPLVKLPAVQSSYRLPRTAVIGSQSHFAVGPFPSTLWFFAAGTSRSRLNAPTHPLFGLALLQSVPRLILATCPPKRICRRLLSWASGPYSTYQHRGSTPRGRCLTRYVPPSGFDYPLDGLLPSTPGRACFIPTALLGFTPPELSPLERWLSRFHDHRTRMPLARRDLPRTNPRTGAPNTDFQALALPRVPGLRAEG